MVDQTALVLRASRGQRTVLPGAGAEEVRKPSAWLLKFLSFQHCLGLSDRWTVLVEGECKAAQENLGVPLSVTLLVLLEALSSVPPCLAADGAEHSAACSLLELCVLLVKAEKEKI